MDALQYSCMFHAGQVAPYRGGGCIAGRDDFLQRNKGLLLQQSGDDFFAFFIEHDFFPVIELDRV